MKSFQMFFSLVCLLSIIQPIVASEALEQKILKECPNITILYKSAHECIWWSEDDNSDHCKELLENLGTQIAEEQKKIQALNRANRAKLKQQIRRECPSLRKSSDFRLSSHPDDANEFTPQCTALLEDWVARYRQRPLDLEERKKEHYKRLDELDDQAQASCPNSLKAYGSLDKLYWAVLNKDLNNPDSIIGKETSQCRKVLYQWVFEILK